MWGPLEPPAFDFFPTDFELLILQQALQNRMQGIRRSYCASASGSLSFIARQLRESDTLDHWLRRILRKPAIILRQSAQQKARPFVETTSFLCVQFSQRLRFI